MNEVGLERLGRPQVHREAGAKMQALAALEVISKEELKEVGDREMKLMWIILGAAGYQKLGITDVPVETLRRLLYEAWRMREYDIRDIDTGFCTMNAAYVRMIRDRPLTQEQEDFAKRIDDMSSHFVLGES